MSLAEGDIMDLDQAIEVLNRLHFKRRRDWTFVFCGPGAAKPEDISVRAQYDVMYMGKPPFELTKAEAISIAQRLVATA